MYCWWRLRKHTWEVHSYEYWVRIKCTKCRAYQLIPHDAAYWTRYDAHMAQYEDTE